MHQVLEYAPPVLKILKLVEAGAGRGEKHDIAGPRGM